MEGKGRLRLQKERVSELLDVALREFLESGLEGASLSEIARRASASKTTFYSRFKTKEQLFLAVLDRHIHEVFEGMSPALSADAPLEVTLREYGGRLAQYMASKQHTALFRIIVMEHARFPALAQRYEELRARRSRDVLTTYLKEQIRRGRLEKRDPADLADYFLNFLFGSLRWIIYGLDEDDPQELAKRVNDTVQVFLHAFSPRPHR